MSHQFSLWIDKNTLQFILMNPYLSGTFKILKPSHSSMFYLHMTLTAPSRNNEMFDSSCGSSQKKALRNTSLLASSGGASSGAKKSSKSCTVCKGKGANKCVPCAGSGNRRFHLPFQNFLSLSFSSLFP